MAMMIGDGDGDDDDDDDKDDGDDDDDDDEDDDDDDDDAKLRPCFIKLTCSSTNVLSMSFDGNILLFFSYESGHDLSCFLVLLPSNKAAPPSWLDPHEWFIIPFGKDLMSCLNTRNTCMSQAGHQSAPFVLITYSVHTLGCLTNHLVLPSKK